MRVLMISVRADHGGGPRHIELLLRYMPENVSAFVACPNEEPYWSRFDALTRGKVCPLPHRSFRLSAALRLARYARDNQIEVIHTHGKGAGLYGRFLSLVLRIPCLHTPHGIHVERYGSVAKWLYRLYENVSSRWVLHLVFVSSEERSAALANGLWTHLPYSVIRNGVDSFSDETLKLARRLTRAEFGIADDDFVVATLSRFDYQKNMQEAYQIVESYPQAIFLWAGDGDDTSLLRERALAGKAGHLKFLGALEDPSAVLAASDVYLSTSRWEGLPLAVLEAMASGLAIVASDVIGHREVVGESGSGFLYPLGQPTDAVERLRQLSNDRDLLRRVGKRAREVQQNRYSAANMTKMIALRYEHILRSEVLH